MNGHCLKKKKSRSEKILKAWVELNIHLHFSRPETNITWRFSLQALAQSPQDPCQLKLSFFPSKKFWDKAKPCNLLALDSFSDQNFKVFSAHRFLSTTFIFSQMSLTLIKEMNPKDINRLSVLSSAPWLHQDRYQIKPRDTLVEVFALLQILMRSSATQCLGSLLMHEGKYLNCWIKTSH